MNTLSSRTKLPMSLRWAIATLLGTTLPVAQALASPPLSAAYSTDAQSSHVEDATSQGIGQVNMITCIMQAMRPDALVNQGNYIALVDENACSPNKSSTGNSGGGGAQASSYTTTVVNSTRASNADPMRVKVWLNQEDEGQTSTIFVNINATAAPTNVNPYGQFRLDFCGKGAQGPCMMNGMLQGAAGALDYYQTENRDNGTQTTALRLTSVGTTTGSGKLSMVQTQGSVSTSTEFLFAYDSNHFLRGDQCFSRDASDPATGFSVWNYGLYDATSGNRVERNSGFPINFTSGGQTYHGFISYWGLNMPAAAGLSTGDTVQKVVYSGNSAPTTTNYTASLAGGKLTKYTRKSTHLHDIDKVEINAWVGNVTGFFSGATPNTQYVLHWDDAQSKFVVTGSVACSQNGCSTQDLSSPQLVNASFWATTGLQGWSPSLGGELYVDLKNLSGSIDSTTVNVSYRQQDIVYPDQLPAQLYCVSNCPTDVSLTSFLVNNSGASPYAASTFNNWSPSNSYVTYTANGSSGVLTTNGNAVVANDANDFQQHPEYQNGIRSGRLVTDPTLLACNTNQYCGYLANDQSVYYVWETGPNTWNQFAGIKDTNGFVMFDAPLQVNYTVPNDAVRYGQYAGKSLVLQYGGFGNLWGIPGACVSALTNLPVSCNQQNARYVPDFVIPFDEATGTVSDGSRTYLVKWLDREIRFARKSLGSCSALTLPGSVTLPDASVLKDPSDPNSDIYIGAKPAVSGEPRVIQGDVKY